MASLTCYNIRRKLNLDSYRRLKLCIEYVNKIIEWVLEIRVITIIFCILSVKTCSIFSIYHGAYHFHHIPAEFVESELYKQRSPKLVLHKNTPDCKYEEVLKSTDSLHNWEVPRKYDDFSAIGLVNGSYAPEYCNALFSVAILVTYRNRQSQLDIFLPYMHNFLRKQNIHYRIYILEQQDEKPFNKGILYNVGAKTAIGDKFPCLIMHDVDLLPLDDSNLYACTNQPRHVSASIDKFRFVLPYSFLTGGVSAIKSEQFVAANGFSNRLHAWGGEDDDFARRLDPLNLKVVRFPLESSHYTMLGHPQERPNMNRFDIIRDNIKNGAAKDGLSTLPHVSASISNHPLFTLVGVQM